MAGDRDGEEENQQNKNSTGIGLSVRGSEGCCGYVGVFKKTGMFIEKAQMDCAGLGGC